MSDPRPWLRTWDVQGEPDPSPPSPPPTEPPTISSVKRQAKTLLAQRRRQTGRRVPLIAIYDELAQHVGFRDWAEFRATLSPGRDR